MRVCMSLGVMACGSVGVCVCDYAIVRVICVSVRGSGGVYVALRILVCYFVVMCVLMCLVCMIGLCVRC